MAFVVPALTAAIGSPLCDLLFATDAMGAAHDFGGWGIVATDVTHDLALECFQQGQRPGRAVCKLNGDYDGERDPSTPFLRKVPFTRLPPSVFELDWTPLAAGRWAYEDHITLGEARAVVRLLRSLASTSRFHLKKVISLEDNAATAGSLAKGRSPSPALNYLCRQRAATTLASRLTLVLPWTETSRMPADDVSRYGIVRPAAPGPPSVSQGSGQHAGSLQARPTPFRGVVGGA